MCKEPPPPSKTGCATLFFMVMFRAPLLVSGQPKKDTGACRRLVSYPTSLRGSTFPSGLKTEQFNRAGRANITELCRHSPPNTREEQGDEKARRRKYNAHRTACRQAFAGNDERTKRVMDAASSQTPASALHLNRLLMHAERAPTTELKTPRPHPPIPVLARNSPNLHPTDPVVER